MGQGPDDRDRRFWHAAPRPFAADLAVFDRQWGFPNPTLNIFKLGKIPKFSTGNASMVGWS